MLTLNCPSTQFVSRGCIFNVRILSALLCAIQSPIHDWGANKTGVSLLVGTGRHYFGAGIVDDRLLLRAYEKGDDFVGLDAFRDGITSWSPVLSRCDSRMS